MNNSEKRAWKKHPLPWKQIDAGDVIDANGHFVPFDELVNEQLGRIVIAMNSIYDDDWLKEHGL